MNKKLDAEEIQNAVRAAADGGLDALKLYGMARHMRRYRLTTMLSANDDRRSGDPRST